MGRIERFALSTFPPCVNGPWTRGSWQQIASLRTHKIEKTAHSHAVHFTSVFFEKRNALSSTMAHPCPPTFGAVYFIRLAKPIIQPSSNHANSVVRKFVSYFGLEAVVVAAVWRRLMKEGLLHGTSFEPKHLLWTLLFLKQYLAEPVHSAMCSCVEKTFRKRVWEGCSLLCDLTLVS